MIKFIRKYIACGIYHDSELEVIRMSQPWIQTGDNPWWYVEGDSNDHIVFGFNLEDKLATALGPLVEELSPFKISNVKVEYLPIILINDSNAIVSSWSWTSSCHPVKDHKNYVQDQNREGEDDKMKW